MTIATSRTTRYGLIGMGLVLIGALLAEPAAALAQDGVHQADPAATAAFAELVKAYRARPALKVKEKLVLELSQGDMKSTQPEVVAELILGPKRQGVVKLRGFTCWLGGGRLTAVHESNDDAYYVTEDDDSPYYALMGAFVQIPFPHLALAFGDDGIDDLCMELHQMAPWVKPTAVGEVTQDGKRYRQIKLTDDCDDLTLLVDPETKLVRSALLTITCGDFVQEGTTMTFRYSYEYETPSRIDPAELTFDPGERQRADMLGSLVAAPPPPVPGAGRGGGDGGNALAGRPAPDFVLSTVAGGAIDLELLRGKVVVLDFWSTWCGPCRQALPLLHQVDAWAKRRDLPVEIITVNVWEIQDRAADNPDARLERVRDFWRKQKFTLPVAMDFTDEVGASYGVRGIPATVVIRADGTVHSMHSGGGADYAEMLQAEIEAALGGDGGEGEGGGEHGQE